MAETIPGGCYKDAQGDGYHDANGNPVSKENVAKFLALQQQQTFGLLQAQLATQAKPEAPENPDGIDLQRLIDETENRAKKKSK